MMLTKRELRIINEMALTNIKDKTKLPDEDGDEFRARCWFEAMAGFFEGQGYELAGLDKTTGATVVISTDISKRAMWVVSK